VYNGRTDRRAGDIFLATPVGLVCPAPRITPTGRWLDE